MVYRINNQVNDTKKLTYSSKWEAIWFRRFDETMDEKKKERILSSDVISSEVRAWKAG